MCTPMHIHAHTHTPTLTCLCTPAHTCVHPHSLAHTPHIPTDALNLTNHMKLHVNGNMWLGQIQKRLEEEEKRRNESPLKHFSGLKIFARIFLPKSLCEQCFFLISFIITQDCSALFDLIASSSEFHSIGFNSALCKFNDHFKFINSNYKLLL